MTVITDEKPQSTIVIDEKALQTLRNDISPIVARAEEVAIRDQQGIEVVKGYIIEDRAIRERGLALIEKPKKNAQELHKWFCAIEKQLTDPIDQARRIYDSKIKGYLDEQDRIAEQKRKEEAERVAKEREASLKRLQAQIGKLTSGISDKEEQVRQLEEMRTPEMSMEEIQAIEAQISVIKAQIGKATEKVESVQMKTEEIQQPYIPPSASIANTKTKGLSAGKKKVGRVVIPMDLVKAVAAGQIPIGVIEFNMRSVNTLLNQGMNLPGVVWEFDRSIKVRG